MKNDMQYTENKILLPFVMTTIFTVLIIWSSINSGMWESQKIIITSSIIWVIWLVLFIMENAKGNIITGEKVQCIVKIFFTIVISLFFANSIWFSGYLTLNPINAIVNGKIHGDTVFHAAIAESIKNYGYPSLLVNDAGFLHYHFGSHFILAILSRVLNVSVFNIYNYLYPIIFIPIYSFLVISVIIEIRKYRKEKIWLSVIDYTFLSFFFIGFVPTFILDKIGIWKSSWIISESYLFALIFSLLYLFLILKIYKSHRYGNVLTISFTFLFIMLCTAMKVSVGFLLSAGAIYINFRKNTNKFKYWIINFIFLAVFLLSYKIFSEASGNSEFQFLSFVRHYVVRYIGFILHYFYLLFFTLFVLCSQLFINTPLKNSILSKKLIIEETLVIISIISLLPGILMKIPGGSAVYFSYFQELIAVCMLLGYNIPDKLHQIIQAELSPTLLTNYNIPDKLQQIIYYKNIILKKAVRFCMLLLTIIVLFNSRTIYSFVGVMNIHNNTINNNFLINIQEIMKISKNEKKRYGIFLEDNAEIWDIYKHNAKVAVFFYPAFTGIRILNGIYTDGTNIFSSNGTYLSNKEDAHYYGVTKSGDTENTNSTISLVPKLTLDEVKKQKIKDINYIIYFYDNKYQIIEI